MGPRGRTGRVTHYRNRMRRPRLTPAVADTRRAVRDSLAGLPEGALVLVALSGGPDSLALAAALAFEGPRAGMRSGAIIVDHGLQEGSAVVAERAADAARGLGLDPVEVRRVEVVDTGEGAEAAARSARYTALDAALLAHDAAAVLLGHTLDDQAETVLLGLARGAGAASLRAMASVAGDRRRPFLELRRATTVAACTDQGLEPWADPHNADPAFLRVRVRQSVLPVLEAELGPGIAEALARTAAQLREDAEALDAMAAEVAEDLVMVGADPVTEEPYPGGGISLPVAALAANPAALRHRLIRLVVAAEFGRSLSRRHTLEVARLVTDWRGQGPIDLPGVQVRRVAGLLVFTADDPAPDAAPAAPPSREQ